MKGDGGLELGLGGGGNGGGEGEFEGNPSAVRLFPLLLPSALDSLIDFPIHSDLNTGKL